MIAETMGPEVTLVDSAEAAAAGTAALLAERDLLRSDGGGPGEENFYVTDAAVRFHGIAESFLGHTVDHLALAELGAGS